MFFPRSWIYITYTCEQIEAVKSHEEFLPEPNNFFVVFSSEWFKVIYYLLMFAKFGFEFSVLNPRKKYQIKMDSLNDT